MKKLKVNVFAEKFRLLNTQCCAEEIIVESSSDSSEFENIPSNHKLCNLSNKKKRKRKQKVPKNMSNLDITFIDPCKDNKIELNTEMDVSKTLNEESKSPILCNTQYFPRFEHRNAPISPILTSKAIDLQSKSQKTLKSPILILKTASSKVSPKVRKKLFDSEDKDTHKLQTRCKSCNESLDHRICNKSDLKNSKSLNITYSIKTDVVDSDFKIVNNNESEQHLLEEYEENNNKKEFNESKTEDINYTIQETPECLSLDDSIAMLKTTSKELVTKVKSYFDSHFSSENASQQTISDIPTPKNSSKTSEEVEIISITTQISTARNSAEAVEELPEVLNKKDKKFKYKKNGLAYRLDSLLKKQTASISLWQHERFLAEHSEFVIPKGEFKAFRICRVHFKYGSYVLDAMDLNDESFLIMINKVFMSDDSVKEDAMLKLYEPYKIIENFQINCKLVLNVCKFECVNSYQF